MLLYILIDQFIFLLQLIIWKNDEQIRYIIIAKNLFTEKIEFINKAIFLSFYVT